MEPALIEEFARQGIMGVVFLVVVIPLAIYARGQSAELKEIQNQRAEDAQATVKQLLGLNDKWNNTVAEAVRTVEAIGATLEDNKGTLNAIRDLLMRRNP